VVVVLSKILLYQKSESSWLYSLQGQVKILRYESIKKPCCSWLCEGKGMWK